MQTNSFRIPFLFIGIGLLLYMGLNLASLMDVQLLQRESIRIPFGWSLAHLGVLGWASMVAMGAIYQMLPVVLQRQIYSERLGYFHFGFYVTGVLGMIYSFFQFNPTLLGWSAGLVAVGICLFVHNMFVTVKLANKWNSITSAVVIAILSLLLTAIIGTAMGIDFGSGFLGTFHQRLFPTHIWLGVIGWFGLLIIGFSFKLLPMFLLAHNYSQRLEPWIIGCLGAGSIGMAISLFFQGSTLLLWSCIALIAVGFGLYWRYVETMNKKRNKQNPGAGIHSAIWVVRVTTAFVVVITILLGVMPSLWDNTMFIRGALYLYLLLWVNGSVLCYMSKIIPFLWWTYRYSAQIGKPGVPALAQLLTEKSYAWVLRILLISHVLFGINLMVGFTSVQAILQVVISLLSMVYAVQLALVFRR